MSNYTPGSWAVEGMGEVFRIVDENGRTLAEVPFRDPDDLEVYETEDFANARLMGAAPVLVATLADLLAAAQQVALSWESGDLAAAVRQLDRQAAPAQVLLTSLADE